MTEKTGSVSEIEAIIPHRPPFLWVDGILQLEPGVRCVTSKRFDANAPFFAGHFPGNPVVPGVFLVEASAQTAGVMLGARQTGRGTEKLLAAIDRFKFLKPVAPDTVIEIETRTLVERDGIALVSAVIRVGKDVVAEGRVTVVSR